MYLAVALDGGGWHPAAWRDPSARPSSLFDPGYWVELARTAERGAIDFLTLEDAFTLQSAHPFRPDDRVDQVRGRLDAALLAARLAPATTRIGLVPTVTTTHTEPFHVSTRIASLDHVSAGRAGWRVQILKQSQEADLFGRRSIAGRGTDRPAAPDEPAGEGAQDLFDEAADSVEVARRLWDSWEDDAEIRDVATDRFIDRDKLHTVDFAGDHFSVRGPAITPRPPQGQPVVTVLAHVEPAYDLAARSADVVFTTPPDLAGVAPILQDVRAAEARVDRSGPPLLVFADLLVLLEDDGADAQAAKARLDELDGRPLRSDAAVVADTPAALAELLAAWHDAGIDGFRLRPARLPRDLDAIVDSVVPALRSRGLVRGSYDELTLRPRLGLARPANRYATGSVAGATA